jgi:hypothetical protein
MHDARACARVVAPMYDARVTLQPTLHFALWFWLCNAQLVNPHCPKPQRHGPLIIAHAPRKSRRRCGQVPAQMWQLRRDLPAVA